MAVQVVVVEAATGKPLRELMLPDAESVALNLGPGEIALPAPAPANSYWDGASWVAIPPPPSPNHRWNYASRVWADPRTTAQIWASVRQERNRRLATSDWIVTRALERGQPVPSAWASYRQALRDITTQTDPAQIVWPSQPEA